VRAEWSLGQTEGHTWLCTAIMHGQGPWDAVEGLWMGDKQVTTGSDDYINEEPLHNLAKLIPHLGEIDQLADDFLNHALDWWTNDHNLFGIAYTVGAYQPQLRVVARTAKIYDPRDSGQDPDDPSTWEWSDNAALVILDYIHHPDGMRIPWDMIAFQPFRDAADICDQGVILSAGGTEKRYRAWGTYQLDEKPKDVLARMLAICDGDLYLQRDGQVALRVGIWEDPTVTIDQDAILGFEIEQGTGKLAVCNTLHISFIDSTSDYQQTECDPWVDNDLFTALGGEVSEDLPLLMAPSFTQARRLGKISMARRNPLWKGTLTCNLRGLALLNERCFRLIFPPYGVDMTAAVTSFEIKGDLSAVTVGFATITSAMFAWDPDTEEGRDPGKPDDSDSGDGHVDPPVPTGLVVVDDVINRTQVQMVVSVDPLSDDIYHLEIQTKDEAGGGWDSYPDAQLGEYSIKTGPVKDAHTYDVEARFIGASRGDWTATVTHTVALDATAPNDPRNVTLTRVDSSTVTVAWKTPNSSNMYATRIYRGTTTTLGSATLVHTEQGPPSTDQSWDDSAATGSLYYWLSSINGSGVESSPAVGPTHVAA
jgi:hypothetical protein